MGKVQILSQREVNNPDDCARIQRVLKERGHEASLQGCEVLWSDYSDSLAAGWIVLDGYDDEEIYERLTPYFEDVDAFDVRNYGEA